MKHLEFIKSKKLLNIDNNAKTIKGQKYGYMTAILYLAPSNLSGFNVCPMASEGCKKACLNTAGHGAFSNVQLGRINKTRWYVQERDTFLTQLRREINNFIKRAKKKELIPCVRLNGTSDIAWETTGIFEEFVTGQLPKNYHLTYSLNEDNIKEAFDILSQGGNISAVFRHDVPNTYKNYKVINADESDLRFTDDVNVICGLKAKGKAIKDYSGFVLG